MRVRAVLAVLLLVLAAPLFAHVQPDDVNAGLRVAAGKRAPGFATRDVDGRKRTLAAHRGRVVTLFLFCGCRPCHEVARAWGDLQRTASLPAEPAPARTDRRRPAPPPATVVVCMDTPAGTRAFARDTGLDRKQTVLISDIELKVAALYDKGLHCPRVVVVDRRGIARYVNGRKDDAPQTASAQCIVSRAVTALRACLEPPARPEPSKPARAPSANQPARKR